VRFQVSAIKKFQLTNTKWFDKPFDRLTVLSRVEGLTTLSKVEGQITMTEIQNSKQLAFDLI
jgi:prophage tail gpP-like protein